MQGGDYIYEEIILILFSLILSYNMVMYFSVLLKRKYVIDSNSKELKKEDLIFKMGFNQKSRYLFNLGYPYGFSLKRYIVIKYIISSFLFLFILINYHNIFASIIIFILFFLLPDIVIKAYVKQESIYLINEIGNIVQNLILSLSANLSLYDSLKLSINSVKYNRFKNEYATFVSNYQLYNFNIESASQILKEKFNSYELNMFLSILIQNQKNGNIIKMLENFLDSLELSYFKFVKFKMSKKSLLLIIVIFVVLLNTLLLMMYPILNQIISNFEIMFK